MSTTSAVSPGFMSVYPCTSSNPFTNNIGNANAATYSKTCSIFANQQNERCNVVRNYMTTPKIWGELDAQDSIYQAAVTTNPATAWFWNVDSATIDGTNFSTTTTYWVVEIIYGVCFEGRITLALS